MNNTIAVIGNVGKDAETRTFGERMKISFSLAVTKRVKKGDAWEDVTSWINCAVWCSAAQRPHLGDILKGSRVAVIGELETRKTESGYWTEIVAQFDGVVVGVGRGAKRHEEEPF